MKNLYLINITYTLRKIKILSMRINIIYQNYLLKIILIYNYLQLSHVFINNLF